MNINELVWIGGGQNFDRSGTLGFGWMRMNTDRNFKFLLELWLVTSSIFEFIRLPTSLFPNKPGTNENLRSTNLLINIHEWTNPTSLFPLPSPPSFLTSILLEPGFSLVGGCLEIDLWQVWQQTDTYFVLSIMRKGCWSPNPVNAFSPLFSFEKWQRIDHFLIVNISFLKLFINNFDETEKVVAFILPHLSTA